MMGKLFLIYFFFFFSSFYLNAQNGFDTLSLVQQEEIYFDFGKYEIKTEADSFLTKVVNICVSKPNIQIKITAHTDNVGSNDNNQILSQKRAQAVKDILVQKGISIDQIKVSVYGEQNPITTNETDEGRQRNRRATIEVKELIEMAYVSGIIKNQDTGNGILANVIVRTKTSRDSLMTDSTGYFQSAVPDGSVVAVDVYAKGYFFETKMMKVERQNNTPITIRLPAINIGEKVAIKNLYFVGNKAVLLKRSEPQLPKVLIFMQLNDTTRIEISGHVNVPTKAPGFESKEEFNLSVRRAKLVFDYLLENGISKSRISFKGYGNSQMLYPTNPTMKQMEMNRRVEILILENEKLN